MNKFQIIKAVILFFTITTSIRYIPEYKLFNNEIFTISLLVTCIYLIIDYVAPNVQVTNKIYAKA